jgi:SAM-dependent methyltransferase
VGYSGRRYWDQYFRGLRETGDDLDWEGQWTAPFLAPLRAAGARAVLELGCGTGNDAARLAHAGYQVTAVDLSAEAIARAHGRHGHAAAFIIADIAAPFPFRDGCFDAVMSNVALHMFADRDTQSVFARIGRLLRPHGLFLFHVNALADRPLRARRLPVARELEPDYVLEESGQAVRFFSESYLRELLRDWSDLQLDAVQATHRRAGEPKQVWRGIARRLPA